MSRPRMSRFALPRNVTPIRSRGREYFYHQRNRGTPAKGLESAPRLSLQSRWLTQRSLEDRYRCLEGVAEPAARAGTFRAMVEAYERSPEWGDRSEKWVTECARYHRVIVTHWGDLDV